jgi:uncharacterized protein (TIGR03435 family)
MQNCLPLKFLGLELVAVVFATAALGQVPPPPPPVVPAPAIASTTPPASKPALAFEVATVRPAGPLDPAAIASGKMRIGLKIDKARVDIGSLTLMDLMQLAFKVKNYQISGPPWLTGERFNIQATVPPGTTEDDVPQMLQGLLAERFGLTYHRDAKEHAVYALIVGKGGPKLKDAPPDEVLPEEVPKGTTTVGAGKDQVRISGNPEQGGVTVKGGPNGAMKMSMGPNGMHMEVAKMSMAQFTEMLSRFMDRPVVDQTELKGNYQLAVDLTMDDLRNAARAAGVTIPAGGPGGGPGGAGPSPSAGAPGGAAPADAASDPSGASIFQSIQLLGLKLEPKKAPLDRIVIDKIEKMPTEN